MDELYNVFIDLLSFYLNCDIKTKNKLHETDWYDLYKLSAIHSLSGIIRHVPYKGLKHLIEASKLCDDKIHFIVAGKGELTEQLKEQAKNDKKVEFIGKISDSEWRSYLCACDIFCFPSVTRNEAFGLALAEGMYYGKPVVTFTIPSSGVNYVNLDGVTGIECPNMDSKAYADAIIKLSNDDNMREKYGEQAMAYIKSNFLFNIFAKNLCDSLEKYKAQIV